MNKMRLFTLLSLLILPSLSWGGFETHGGSAVVCKNTDGTLKSVKLLDSYEAKIRYGLTLFPEDISGEELLARVDETLTPFPFLLTRIKELIPHFYRMMLPVPDGHTFTRIEDINPIVMEDGCTIEQLAVYDEVQNVLLYRESLFNKMCRRDQEALFLHEAIFAIARSDRNVTNSTSARHLTAMLISEWSQRNDDPALERQVSLVSLPNIDGFYIGKSQESCVNYSEGKPEIIDTRVEVKFNPSSEHLMIHFENDQRCFQKKLIPALPLELKFDAETFAWVPLVYEPESSWELRSEKYFSILVSKRFGFFNYESPLK